MWNASLNKIQMIGKLKYFVLKRHKSIILLCFDSDKEFQVGENILVLNFFNVNETFRGYYPSKKSSDIESIALFILWNNSNQH